jgi:tetratricopeptide (TPR) repeat protein
MKHGRILIASALCLLLASCATTPPASTLASEWYELGNGWYDLGKWDKAGAAYAKALALDPGLMGASFNMARALSESGDYDAALRAVDRTLESSPENLRALSLKAYILYKKGDVRAALKTYDAVLLLDPYAPDAIYNSALLREAAGDSAGAAADLERLLSVKTDDTEALALYARVLAKLDRGDEALSALERLRGLGKAGAGELERLGELYEGGKDYAKAIDAYAAAVAADSKRGAAWFALARLKLVEAEDGKGGLEALGKALESGFSDKSAAAALLSSPALVEREAVLAALKAKGLAE